MADTEYTFFKGGELTWANACVGNNGSPSYLEYARGYAKASNLILDTVIKDEGIHHWVDDFIYPICFNLRHSIELYLKYICQKFLEKIFIIKNEPLNFNYSSSHDIGIIWSFVKEKALKAERESVNLINEIDFFVVELSKIDATGQTFRYPYSNKNEKHLTKNCVINLVELKDHFNKIEFVFNKLVNFFSDVLDDYSLGYFSGDLSKNDLFKMAKRLPQRADWGKMPFKQIKTHLKSEYCLSSNQLSNALTVMQSKPEFARILGLELPLFGCNVNDIRLAAALWHFYHREGAGLKLVAKYNIISMGDSESKDCIIGRIKLHLARNSILTRKFSKRFSVEKINGLRALYYSEGEYSVQCKTRYDIFMEGSTYFDDLLHVLKKERFIYYIVKSLYQYGYNELANELRNKFISNEGQLSSIERFKDKINNFL